MYHNQNNSDADQLKSWFPCYTSALHIHTEGSKVVFQVSSSSRFLIPVYLRLLVWCISMQRIWMIHVHKHPIRGALVKMSSENMHFYTFQAAIINWEMSICWYSLTRDHYIRKWRSSRPMVFCKKVIFKSFVKLAWKHLAEISYWQNYRLKACSFIKKKLQHSYFSKDFAKLFRTSFQ